MPSIRCFVAAVVLLTLTACPSNSSPTPPAVEPSHDATLWRIDLAPGEITPAFQPDVFEYTATVAPEVAEVHVTPWTRDPMASVWIDGPVTSWTPSRPQELLPGPNRLAIEVVAEDESTRLTYFVTVTRLVRPTLSGLALSSGVLAPTFAPTTTVYESAVGFLELSVRVIATSPGEGVVITVNGESVASGQSSLPLALAEGVNDILVRVTDAQALSREYLVHVRRQFAAEFAQEAYVKASNTGSNDEFGYAVALDGDTLVVGADREDSAATGVNGDQGNDGATNSGAVYVFVRDGNDWSQQAYLKASNTEAGDFFGFAVAIRGNTIAVGAYLEDSAATGVGGDQANNAAADSGAVYVFTRSDATWTQQAYVKASNTGPGDSFGVSVALGDDRLVVGAYLEDSAATGVGGDQANNAASASGAVYVFGRSGGVWTQDAYVKASNTGVDDQFGLRVAVAGDTLAVGAYLEDSAATGIDGDQASNGAPDSGAVYVFVRDGGSWSQQAYVKASNTGSGDQFGVGLALHGETLAVGANHEDSSAVGIGGDQANNGAPDSGAVYVFVRDGGSWSQQAYVKASNTGSGDEFGLRVALSGDLVAVGASQEDSAEVGVNGNQASNGAGNSGAAYVFARRHDLWEQIAYVKASNTEAGDLFGFRLALDASTLVVGATGEDSNATGINGGQFANGASGSGAVYVRR